MDHYCFEPKAEKLKAEAEKLKAEAEMPRAEAEAEKRKADDQQKWLKAGGFTIVRRRPGKPLGPWKRPKQHT